MTILVSVDFSVEVEEIEDRVSFQREGHFVPAMTDEHGFRREWEGYQLFIGTLWHEAKDATGKVTERLQVLRVLADTLPELHRLMSESIRGEFFARYLAAQQQTTVYEEYRRHAEEHNELVAWLVKTGRMEEGGHAGLSTAALAKKFCAKNLREAMEA